MFFKEVVECQLCEFHARGAAVKNALSQLLDDRREGWEGMSEAIISNTSWCICGPDPQTSGAPTSTACAVFAQWSAASI